VAHTDSGCLVDIHLTRTSYAEAIRRAACFSTVHPS
jgi:hypothetical protein